MSTDSTPTKVIPVKREKKPSGQSAPVQPPVQSRPKQSFFMTPLILDFGKYKTHSRWATPLTILASFLVPLFVLAFLFTPLSVIVFSVWAVVFGIYTLATGAGSIVSFVSIVLGVILLSRVRRSR